MPKEDIKQINSIAKDFRMTKDEIEGFGEFIEEAKRLGDRGTKNDREILHMKNLNKRQKNF
ncbi:hypothetical protein [Chroococcus sp. FPU101]|uniref:hypothetical protein n=1 Tax=Chroococcus sp. FPU101 TaxID=1974212 RepID=UPI001A8E08C8|nr:hypothetical protein [Chroococcus sp. FPU101]GFE68254.1 hypothetical protein CFPU101_08640 [Chroococcus sp. FPU101]